MYICSRWWIFFMIACCCNVASESLHAEYKVFSREQTWRKATKTIYRKWTEWRRKNIYIWKKENPFEDWGARNAAIHTARIYIRLFTCSPLLGGFPRRQTDTHTHVRNPAFFPLILYLIFSFHHSRTCWKICRHDIYLSTTDVLSFFTYLYCQYNVKK